MAIEPTALAALLISLVALFATTGQLLQQYFATADGYRRCQPSVMGPFWGSKTRLNWLWREFRFETIYFVPRLSIKMLYEFEGPKARIWDTQSAVDAKKIYFLLSRDEEVVVVDEAATSQAVTGDDDLESLDNNGEKVCWVSLIDHLHLAEKKMKNVYPDFDRISELRRQSVDRTRKTSASISALERRRTHSDPRSIPIGFPEDEWTDTTVPCLQVCQRSWDFMAPDVVRPLCLSTLSDVVSFAFRLGMKWQEFDPGDGKLRAEGRGHMFTSRFVRSIGLCLEYTSTRPIERHVAEVRELIDKTYLPVAGILDLAFGVVPGNRALHCWDRPMGTIPEITSWLNFIDNARAQLSETIVDAVREGSGWLPGINDLICLTAPKFSKDSTLLCNIPMPNAFSPGLLRTQEGLGVFLKRLEDYVSKVDKPSRYLKRVQELAADLERLPTWKKHDSKWAYLAPFIDAPGHLENCLAERAAFHRAFDEVESYLIEINKDPLGSIQGDRKEGRDGFCYDSLTVEHTRMAVIIRKNLSPADAAKYRMIEAQIGDKEDLTCREWLKNDMHAYWDAMPTIADRMVCYTGCQKQLVIDAWIMMIFRGFLWHHCHRFRTQKMILPVVWHRSQLPVFMG